MVTRDNPKQTKLTKYLLMMPVALAICVATNVHAQSPTPPPPPPSPVEVFNKMNPFKRKKKADTTSTKPADTKAKADTVKAAPSGPPPPPNPLDLFKKKKKSAAATKPSSAIAGQA